MGIYKGEYKGNGFNWDRIEVIFEADTSRLLVFEPQNIQNLTNDLVLGISISCLHIL